jgi:dephospho-CoA kinase
LKPPSERVSRPAEGDSLLTRGKYPDADGGCSLPVKPTHVIAGLTGGIAGGKSTVSRMFRDFGAQPIDFDALARMVVEPGTPGLEKVVGFFGKQILRSDGTLDRKKLSGIVFRDAAKRRMLERLIHPDITEVFFREVSRITKDLPDAIIVAEVPLLIEANLTHLFDTVIVVVASEPVQVERLVRRQELTEKEAIEMLKTQLPIEEKKKVADHVVYNDGSLEATRRQVRAVWEKLIAFRRQQRGAQRGPEGENR